MYSITKYVECTHSIPSVHIGTVTKSSQPLANVVLDAEGNCYKIVACAIDRVGNTYVHTSVVPICPVAAVDTGSYISIRLVL